MKIIVGLGNPGDKYKITRHNVGFLALDKFLENQQTISCESKFKGTICEMHFHSTKTFFVKPKTYMNHSGEAVREIAKFYKIDTARDLLVVHDELDLPFGEIRTTKSSRAAGHNGVQNIIDELGTQDFYRIRIGVESRPERTEIPSDVFVLSPFNKEEIGLFERDISRRVNLLITQFITTGII